VKNTGSVAADPVTVTDTLPADISSDAMKDRSAAPA
jgi:hypothetical protein